MIQAEQPMEQPTLPQRLGTELRTFMHEHRRALQITGLVAVAGVTGAAGGVLFAKGIAASKGSAAMQLMLAGKGAAATKAGTTSLPAILSAQSTNTIGAATPAVTGASLQSIANLLNNTTTSGVALVDKVAGLWQAISTNVLPLTAGVVGGGAAGVGVTQQRVRKVKEQLDVQLAQTEALQAETMQLRQAVDLAESNVTMLQATLESSAAATETAKASVQRELEQIHGIGRVFSRRLQEAGIYTLADLAAQTPETIEAIIGTSRAGALVHPEVWIAEAHQLLSAREQ